MSIIWLGAEDISFPSGGAIAVSTSTSFRRTSFTRCAITGTAATASFSLPFPGGAVTDFWMSAWGYYNSTTTNARFLGLAAAASEAGLWIGAGSSSTKLALYSYDGSSQTLLQAEAGTSFALGLHRFDVHVTNYGLANTEIDVYLDGTLLIQYTNVGGLTVTNAATMSRVGLRSNNLYVSEIVVAAEDTRSITVQAQYISAAGDASAWNGSYSDINGTTLSTAAPLNVNAADADALFDVAGVPGSYPVKAVMITARASKTVDAAIGGLKLGIKSEGTIDVGASQALATTWGEFERLIQDTNPVTGLPWTVAEMNALQLALRSAA